MATIVVGWSSDEAARANRPLEWSRAFVRLAWAAKLVLLAITLGSLAVARTPSQFLVYLAGAMLIAAAFLLIGSLRRAVPLDYASPAAARRGWLCAGGVVIAPLDAALSDLELAALGIALPDEEALAAGAWDPRDWQVRTAIPARLVEGVQLRPGSEVGFARLEMRVRILSRTMLASLEVHADEAEAQAIRHRVDEALAVGRTTPDPDPVGERRAAAIIDSLVQVPSRIRLRRGAVPPPGTLAVRVLPTRLRHESFWHTSSRVQVLSRGAIHWSLSSVAILLGVFCVSNSGTATLAALAVSTVAWLGLTSRALAAAARRRKGETDGSLLVGPMGLVEDRRYEGTPGTQWPTEAVAMALDARPDRREPFTLLLRGDAEESLVQLPVRLDAAEARAVARELSRRAAGGVTRGASGAAGERSHGAHR